MRYCLVIKNMHPFCRYFIICKAIPSSLFYEEYWQEELLMALRSMTDIAYKHEMAEQRRTIEKLS